jgi:hypothetical protein
VSEERTEQFRPLNAQSQLSLKRAGVSVVSDLPAASVDRAPSFLGCVVQTGVAEPERELARRSELASGYVSPAADVLRVEHGVVEPRMATALTSDGHFLPETLRNRRQAEENAIEFLDDGSVAVPSAPIVEHPEPLILVGLPTGENYFHWMLEAVGRLLAVDSLIPGSARVLTHGISRFKRECLNLAGAGDDRILEAPSDAMIRSSELYVAPRGLKGASDIRPGTIEALSRLAPKPPPLNRRIFVSRAATRRRRIVNEGAVMELLGRYAFESVRTEELSVSEQARLFASASAVLSLHGAGLTNITFCQPGSLVVELQPPAVDDARVVLFWNIAAIRGLRYAQIVCAQAESGDKSTPDSARDVEVDLALLDKVLTTHLPSTI